MHSAQPLSFDSLHEASHVVLGAYVGATDIHVVLHFDKPRCNFTHFQAMPGLVMSYAGYAGDRLLAKLPEADCLRRSTSDREIRQMILRDMANTSEASVFAEAKRRALELVQRFPNEIGEAAALIQRAMWQRRSIPADEIEQLEGVIRVRALGVAEAETEARPGDAVVATSRGETRPLRAPLYPTLPGSGRCCSIAADGFLIMEWIAVLRENRSVRKLFTERHGMAPARVGEALTPAATTALLGLVNARTDEHWFGEQFPDWCPDGPVNIGCDLQKLKAALAGYRVIWPKDWPDPDGHFPGDAEIFDLLEFSYEHVALPRAYDHHGFFRHDHLAYDAGAGRERFAHDVNRIFERHGLAFELREGEIVRLAPTGLQEALAVTVFQSGDADLDRLLEVSREKFLNRELAVRKEGLEKLWDAWERLKTIESGKDKKAQTSALLDRAVAEPVLRERIDCEARELPFLGNNLMIRHTEVGKPGIAESAQVDYLFHRMFAMVRLLLKSSNRGG